MRPMPIRLRLTLWYFSILAAGLLAFAFLILATLQHAVHRTVDNQLREHMSAVRKILNEDENGAASALQHDLDEDAELAPDLTLLKIWGRQGNVVYRSPAMARFRVSDNLPQTTERPITRRGQHHHPLRVLVRDIATPHAGYLVFVAIPIRDFAEAIQQVENTLWILIPLLLLLAALGGYWVAGRALSPVLSMIAAAEAIHPGDLSARLQVPAAADELQRLALTLNRMLARMQAGFERITRFTADASHELRTPVALLRTRAEVLLRRTRTPAEYQSALQASLQELENTSALLEELLLLARADAGAETLQFADVHLDQLVRVTVADMQALTEEKHLSWSLELPPQSVQVRGDAGALRRMLLVLLDNAVKYTPEHGAIAVALHSRQGRVEVEIRDTGIGIAEPDLAHIFERFYRADPARVRTNGGVGLGLSIGRWIAERHGGSITVESTPGSGSVFRVALPQ